MSVKDIKILIERGYFSYGSQMTVEEFGNLDNIKHPDLVGLQPMEAIKAYDTYRLKLVSLYTTINDQLLVMGRKLYLKDEMYNVATVSETLNYASQYFNQAKKKSNRGNKLMKGFQTMQVDATIVNTKMFASLADEMGVKRQSANSHL